MMTKEIELLKQEIKMLQSKLEFLEELEKTKSPVEEAFKRVYGTYPSSYDKSVFWTESDEDTWISFQKGYTSAKEDYKVGEYDPTPQERGDRIHKEVEKLLEKNWYVDAKDLLIERETTPPEPTSSEFRQKLFDGIKSVFYDPDYERTHWKMKVNMSVDEVLTHFYEVIPDEDGVPYNGYDEGWNSCIRVIKQAMEMKND